MQAHPILTAPDGAKLPVHGWPGDGAAKAVVQIAHGLAEHAGRYAELAGSLNAAGYAVYAADHRGHGGAAAGPDDLGFFAERDGWRACLDDLWRVNRAIAAEHPGAPLILLGHSMGSFLAQQFMAEHGDVLAGAVLSASDALPPLAPLGRWLARIERRRLGPRGRSPLLHALSFASFNRPFRPARTEADWLSRDPAEVDRYLADPLCGFRPTVQLWIDLLDGMAPLLKPQRLARIPKELPVLIIAGARDPVSNGGRRLEKLAASYRAAGLRRVTLRLYPEARHELFHEINRAEVTRDLVAWLDGMTAP